MDDRQTRLELLRLFAEQRGADRLGVAHSLRGKTCPIQRPGLKR